MADIILDIEVKGKKELKAAADEFMRAGKVSKKLAESYDALAAKNKRAVDETRRLRNVEKQLIVEQERGNISRYKRTQIMDEEKRKSREKVLTDKVLIDQEKKRIKLLEEDAKRTAKLVKLYAPAKVALATYKKQILEITTAQKQKIISDKEAATALAQLKTEYQQFTAGVATGGNQFAKFNVEAYRANQRMKRFASVGLQQAGYQVGDFIVQVQSGQSVLVALGQQGSQLAGIFGPTGAVVGAFIAAATAFGMIAVAASKAKKSMSDVQDLSKTFAPATKTMTDAIKNQRMEIFKLVNGIEDSNEAIGKQALEYQKALQSANKFLDSQDGLSRMQRLRANGIKVLGFQLVKGDKERVEQLEKQNEIYAKLQDQAEKLKAKEEKRKKFLEEQLELKQKFLDAGKDILDQEAAQSLAANVAAANEEEKLSLLRERVAGTMTAAEAEEQALRQKLRLEYFLLDNADELIEKRVEQLREERSLSEELKEQLRILKLQEEFLTVTQRMQEGSPAARAMRKYAGRGTISNKDPIFGTGPREGQSIYKEPRKTKAIKDPLQELMKNLMLQKRLFGVEEDRASVMKALGESYSKYTPEQIDSAIKLTESIRKQNEALKEQQDELDRLKDTAEQLAAPFDDFFMSLVDGTTTVSDAFKVMASDILKELYRVLVVKQTVSNITDLSGDITSLMSGSNPFAGFDGGGYTGSGPRSGGLDGKGGFMAMLHPRETVVDHTKGQGIGGATINQVFNISANTSDDTKRLITKTIEQSSSTIVNQSVNAVMDRRRRGGSMKSVFG